VDSQSGRGRFVIEPPEVGAVLAGMTVSAGAAAARRSSPAAADAGAVVDEGGSRHEDSASSSGESPAPAGGGEEDSVTVHASEGGLSPSPVAPRERPRSRSTSSSESSSSHGEDKRVPRVASAVVKLGDVQAALASLDEPRDSRAGASNERRDEVDIERRGDRRVVLKTHDSPRVAKKPQSKRNARGQRRKERRVDSQQHVGLHDSERRIQENLVRSPEYGDFVPLFSPPPPFPGYSSQGGYVPAAAAGSSSDRARDAQYGVRPDQRREGERGRSRGRSVPRQDVSRARSPAGGRARSRGRSTARQRDIRERSPLHQRARSRGRSTSRRRDDDRSRSRGRSVGAREDARRGGADQRQRRNRSRSRSRR
jgi:hypothetical protein